MRPVKPCSHSPHSKHPQKAHLHTNRTQPHSCLSTRNIHTNQEVQRLCHILTPQPLQQGPHVDWLEQNRVLRLMNKHNCCFLWLMMASGAVRGIVVHFGAHTHTHETHARTAQTRPAATVANAAEDNVSVLVTAAGQLLLPSRPTTPAWLVRKTNSHRYIQATHKSCYTATHKIICCLM